MKTRRLLVVAVVTASVISGLTVATPVGAATKAATKPAVTQPKPCGGEVVRKSTGGNWTCTFDDEFNGTSLNTKDWTAVNTATMGARGGQECNTSKNVRETMVRSMSEDQPWRRRDLGNPVYATLLALLFEWGVAVHDLEVERIEAGEIEWGDKRDILRAIWRKGRRQVLKDYVVFPLLAGPAAPFVFTGNLTANLTRNVWSFMIIFCGHFPEGTHEFTEEEAENETRGGWYMRQMLGSANLTGGKAFHVLSGNLSHQIEHHLFPDIPAHRYAEIAVEVREICARYGLDYNTGPLHKQFGSVVKKIVRLALPGGSADKLPSRAEPERVPGPDRQTFMEPEEEHAKRTRSAGRAGARVAVVS
jgi:hypothetical protein